MRAVGQRDGEAGRLDIGGGLPGLTYTEVPVTGGMHWSVDMSRVSVGGTTAGCHESARCTAILDSGTSLIAAPPDDLEKILSLIGEARAAPETRSRPTPDTRARDSPPPHTHTHARTRAWMCSALGELFGPVAGEVGLLKHRISADDRARHRWPHTEAPA